MSHLHFPIRTVEKKWGWEDWLVNEPEYCAKYLHIVRGHYMSVHRHLIKKETLMVTEGSCLLTRVYDDVEKTRQIFELETGDEVTILPGEWHSFWCDKQSCTLLEVSTHHDDRNVERQTVSQ